MIRDLPPVRLVVAGCDASGRSRIIKDGPPVETKNVPERPGYRVSNLWTTLGSPAIIDEPDRISEIHGVLPPTNGTILRIIDFPPEPKDSAERDRLMRVTFLKLYPDADHRPDGGMHPGMHTTDTVDYALVLEGEIYAVMDDEETLLKAGDVFIQRGTNHAWCNRSEKVCRIAFVLIDGRRSVVVQEATSITLK